MFVNVVRDLRKAQKRARETGRANYSFILLFHNSIDSLSVRSVTAPFRLVIHFVLHKSFIPDHWENVRNCVTL